MHPLLRGALSRPLALLCADVPAPAELFCGLGEARARAFLQRLGSRLAHTGCACGGWLLGVEGASLRLAFAQATAALDAAYALGEELLRCALPLQPQVRLHLNAGLSWGPMRSEPGSAGAAALQRALALAAAARDGQILLDDEAADALGDKNARQTLRLVDLSYEGLGTAAAWCAPPRLTPAPAAEGPWLCLCWGEDRQRLLFAPGQPVRIGRVVTADVMIDRPEVSRVHANIVWSQGCCLWLDASRNGTWLSDRVSGQTYRAARPVQMLPTAGAAFLGRRAGASERPDLTFTLVLPGANADLTCASGCTHATAATP